jgi:hypothetical protein
LGNTAVFIRCCSVTGKKKYIFNPRCMEKLIGRCSGFQLQCAILIFFWNSSSRSSADIETWDIDIPLHHDA